MNNKDYLKLVIDNSALKTTNVSDKDMLDQFFDQVDAAYKQAAKTTDLSNPKDD